MREMLKSFFMNKTVLALCAVLALCIWVISGLLCIESAELYEKAVDSLLYIALIAGILVAYRAGETSAQKALIGALLMLLCKSSIDLMWEGVDSGDSFSAAVNVATAVLAAVIFAGHILLQSDHAGKKSAIFINQLCGAAAVLILVYALRKAFLAQGNVGADLMFTIAWMPTYMMLICIETRIQEYKKLRTEAMGDGAWTEEKRAEAKKLFKI